MLELIVILLPIALVDMVLVLPTHSAVILLQLNGPQARTRSIAFMLGFFCASYGAGLIIALGVDWLLDLVRDHLLDVVLRPSPLVYGLQLIIGLALIIASDSILKRQRISPDPQAQSFKNPVAEKAAHKGIAGSFGLGFALSLAGIPSALTYFAAIDQMLKAELRIEMFLTVLLFYNLVVVLPLLLYVALSWVAQERSAQLMQRLSQRVHGWAQRAFYWLLVTLGVILTADGVAFFVGLPALLVLRATS